MQLSDGQVSSIVSEIAGQAEVDRRAMAKKRVDIYKDGGKGFLIEQTLREFNSDAMNEMRLTPINLLKKIVDKRASIYKKAPTRKAEKETDQALLDYYVKALDLNLLMGKLNRYLVLCSNSNLYLRPYKGKLKGDVVPSYNYSLVPNEMEMCEAGAVVFSSFAQAGSVTPQTGQRPATGVQSYSQDQSFKSQGDLVASNEKTSDGTAKSLIFWTDEQHFTTDGAGNKVKDPSKDSSQWDNPIKRLPNVLVARDRDNEVWATQGEDMIDLTIALQMGWTDVMTIAKHQGYGILTITSEDRPQKLVTGVNRSIWLKTTPTGPTPSINYAQSNAPLNEYKELLMELLRLLLTTNSMNPGSVGGNGGPQNFTSGFHALIAAADALEAVEADKPIMQKAEEEAWEIIALWHNWMADTQMLDEEARALGKFSEDFKPSVTFCDIKPIESEDEIIARIKALRDLGLLTRIDAMKKLHPELTEEQLQAKLKEIDDEATDRMAAAQEALGTGEPMKPEDGQEPDPNAPAAGSPDEKPAAGQEEAY